jgi:hypothetical protein
MTARILLLNHAHNTKRSYGVRHFDPAAPRRTIPLCFDVDIELQRLVVWLLLASTAIGLRRLRFDGWLLL